MITWVRTAKTFPGRFVEGAAWAKEISATVERLIGKQLVVCTSFGGSSGEIAWIGQFDSAAQVEEAYLKVTASRDYRPKPRKFRLVLAAAPSMPQLPWRVWKWTCRCLPNSEPTLGQKQFWRGITHMPKALFA